MNRIVIFVALLFLMNLEACRSSRKGCPDPLANNLEAEAVENDGSCTYDEVWIRPVKSMLLDETLRETSGLIFWDGNLWTHNDNSDTRIYALDTANASIQDDYLLQGVENINWEEMGQDTDFIYLGDFGNNASGNREDLHILRIRKSSLLAGNPSIDSICFSYSDQIDLSPVDFNQTEFDCEAFVVSSESIYLFTKRWVSGHTTAYALPKQPGVHVARKLHSLDINGLVSGACFFESKQLLVLTGYTGTLQPFLYLLYDFPGHNFFAGNKRRINIGVPFLQLEGIASLDGLNYYVSNESFVKAPVSTSPQLHRIELHSYLENYLNGIK